MLKKLMLLPAIALCMGFALVSYEASAWDEDAVDAEGEELTKEEIEKVEELTENTNAGQSCVTQLQQQKDCEASAKKADMLVEFVCAVSPPNPKFPNAKQTLVCTCNGVGPNAGKKIKKYPPIYPDDGEAYFKCGPDTFADNAGCPVFGWYKGKFMCQMPGEKDD